MQRRPLLGYPYLEERQAHCQPCSRHNKEPTKAEALQDDDEAALELQPRPVGHQDFQVNVVEQAMSKHLQCKNQGGDGRVLGRAQIHAV